MLAKDETRSQARTEISVIPAWGWVVAGIAFVAAQVLFDIFIAREKDAPPMWGRILLGLLVGVVVGCWILFLGYINRDSRRRGMSPTLWTVVAIVIPNALGIILYFVLRQPLLSSCPQCGHAVQAGFSFCPHCSCKLSPTCPSCQRAVGASDLYCPYCGASLQSPVSK
jgi:hypothetical protein